MSPRRHSTTASDPVSTGDPVTPGDQPTPSNLSPPDTANVRHNASWCSSRMFTQNAPAWRIRGQLVELRAGARITMGGSSDRAAKDWQVKPTGSPSSSAVTTVIPVAKCPSTSRNRASSRPVTTALRLAEVDRLGFVSGGHVFDVLRLGQPPRLGQDPVQLAVRVGRI